MKEVLHLSARDNQDGAARATYRLHQGLQTLGVDSNMLVQKKVTEDPSVDGTKGYFGAIYDTVRRKIDTAPLIRYRDRDPDMFSPAWLPDRRGTEVTSRDPDVVNLHWVAGGFLHPDTVSTFETPVVWTLHDMWPFTGGCHYVGSCEKYKKLRSLPTPR